MKKEECIRRYGEETYRKRLQQRREWYRTHANEEAERSREWVRNHPERAKEIKQIWASNHPEEVIANHIKFNPEIGRKGGKYYEQKCKYNLTGLQHERGLVRKKHEYKWSPYKQIIAPCSQCHHQWVPGMAEYTGLALVEKDQHMHGYIDVIQILEGEITLFTEEEIRKGGSRI